MKVFCGTVNPCNVLTNLRQDYSCLKKKKKTEIKVKSFINNSFNTYVKATSFSLT